MFFYDKKIIYLNVVKGNENVGGAGHLKLEVFDDVCSIEVVLSKIPSAVQKELEIFAVAGEKKVLLGCMACSLGKGKYKEKFPIEKIGKAKDKITYEDWVRILINIDSNHYIEGIIQNKTASSDQISEPEQIIKQKDNTKMLQVFMPGEVPVSERALAQEETDEGEYAVDTKDLSASSQAVKAEETAAPVWITLPGKKIVSERPVKKEQPDNQRDIKKKNVVNLAEKLKDTHIESMPQQQNSTPVPEETENDKWRRLLNQYKQIHPYGDYRVYISIEPKDFDILHNEYQHLVNNSFLLHGFYNYRHIILGNEKRQEINSEIKEEEVYYLGVPGVYYEREKMVAQMFGFEAFECEGGNAETGKFGYYLYRVKI